MKKMFYFILIFSVVLLGISFFFFSQKDSFSSQEESVLKSSLDEKDEHSQKIEVSAKEGKQDKKTEELLNSQKGNKSDIRAKDFEEKFLPQMRVLIETDLLSKEKKEEQREWFESEEKLLEIFANLSLYSDYYEKNPSEGENEFYFYPSAGNERYRTGLADD